MDLNGRFAAILIIVLIIMNTKLYATPVRESLVNADLNGEELIKMGNVLENPLLTLLGETFVNMEQTIDTQLSNELQILKTELCKLRTCTDWTKWSKCSARKVRTFGASSRTRTCGGKSSICPSNETETVETESKICQGTCKYTFTKNNFCIKLNDTVQMSWKSAQEECETLGGHLLNIDSELKAADVDEMLEKNSFKYDVWTDGTRSLPNGEWKHRYGSEDNSFSKWKSGEPESTDDCKAYVLSSGKRWWYGRKCTNVNYFLCEML